MEAAKNHDRRRDRRNTWIRYCPCEDPALLLRGENKVLRGLAAVWLELAPALLRGEPRGQIERGGLAGFGGVEKTADYGTLLLADGVQFSRHRPV